jgi:DNA-binding LacI/PurR family transcriptional regulator
MFRSKLTVLDPGVVMSTPSPRVRVIYDNRNHATQKEILYVGFTDKATAEACYSHLLAKGHRHYDRATDTGMNKPRKAERVDGMAWEIKYHRPTAALVDQFVTKDLARA